MQLCAAEEPCLLTPIKYIILVPQRCVCSSNFLLLKDFILYESLVKSMEFSAGNVSERVSSFLIFKKKLTSFSLKSNHGSPSTSWMWQKEYGIWDLTGAGFISCLCTFIWATLMLGKLLISLSLCLLINQILYSNPVKSLYIEEEMK